MSDISKIVESRTTPLKEWVIQKYGDVKGDYFREWWESEMRPMYDIVYFEWLENIGCSEFHKLMFNDDAFFQKIHDYMESVNWTWGETKESPNIEQLKSTVLDLSHFPKFNGDREGGCCSSGGFEVTFYPKKHLKVVFKSYYDDEKLYEKTISTTDLRELKLERVLQ